MDLVDADCVCTLLGWGGLEVTEGSNGMPSVEEKIRTLVHRAIFVWEEHVQLCTESLMYKIVFVLFTFFIFLFVYRGGTWNEMMYQVFKTKHRAVS